SFAMEGLLNPERFGWGGRDFAARNTPEEVYTFSTINGTLRLTKLSGELCPIPHEHFPYTS
ncbi:MAG: hypothetical protein ACTH1B_08490, partial [Yaniella sp.]|uniref:hypothetical protein n=1 Tax=Yaniella sp. TaxID=2773929 RepID=UPI0026535DAD|nr:hypothetical protein [Yaniella sp.]